MKVLFLFSFLFIFTIGCDRIQNLNLDFEEVEQGMPKGWSVSHQGTGFSVALDSMNVKSGKYALAMEFAGDIVDYHAFTLKLPLCYDGNKITLSGYIKTENVTDGFAGLWLMVEPDVFWRPYEISFMEQEGITGTTDWRKYEITLDLPFEKEYEIEIGGLLSGKGKMWLDDLEVSIDGKDIKKAKQYEPKHFKATDDKEFDMRSNVVFPELSQQKTSDLELLGRIWGFLKYHHPQIAKGNYNWDYELFRFLPVYLKATDHQQRDEALIDWINQYGKISECKGIQLSDNVFLKPDLSWIDTSDASLKLKNLLHIIYKNRNQGYNYYVSMRSYIGNAIFTNEAAYTGKEYLPDAGFRLLSLFRYWNIINYFYPYKYVTDKHWDSILQEYIPSFIKAESRLEYELISARLLGEICDSHAFLYEGWDRMKSLKGSRQVPGIVKFVEDRLVVMDAKDTELKRGDIITHIDGKSVESIIDSVRPYYPASNEMSRKRVIAQDILCSERDYISIQYNSSGKTKQKDVYTERGSEWFKTYSEGKNTVPCYKFIDKNIGYINLENITKEDIPVIKKEFLNTKGIIIDIRNYPPDVFNLLAPSFVSKTTSFSKSTRGNVENPGEFTFTATSKIPESEVFYEGKVIVLVNEETASNAEYTAMAFRAGNNTTIIGSQTGGVDGNMSQIILPGGLSTFISGNGIYYPDGKETQRIGIIPDIEVKPTIKGIKEGRDELLEKAIEIIKIDVLKHP